MSAQQPTAIGKIVKGNPMVLAAMGVVFGDICTSPIYAFRESFAGHRELALTNEHILGVLSLIFWSIAIVVSAKYVILTMRADNEGEGGSLALLSLITKSSSGAQRGSVVYILLGICATSLFFGDSIVTPAISVLSAVEGLEVINPAFEPVVVPLALIILGCLFFAQRKGSASIGRYFGPIILVYCIVLSILGIRGIIAHPSVLVALNPMYAANFFINEPLTAFLALGAVVLAVTGAEAVYTDMGQFGKRPIRLAWFYVVMPSLFLNYAGQAGMLIDYPDTIEAPFFMLAPEFLRLPLVVLAAMATVIASQAVISGAFSMTHQAMQLGFLPRFRIIHTSRHEHGEVYIPFINLVMMFLVMSLVLAFESSSNLGAAYGIAVTGTMVIDSLLLAIVMHRLWHWHKAVVIIVIGLFLIVEVSYFLSNVLKLFDGGWVPVVFGTIAFIFLTTWSKGRKLLRAKLGGDGMSRSDFLTSTTNVQRVPGTAVFMSAIADNVPTTLLHNLKHNKVLHERILLLQIQITDTPQVDDATRISVEDWGEGFHTVVIRYGFMESMDVPKAMGQCPSIENFRIMDTTFFLGRQTIRPAITPTIKAWRRRLFSWMLRNSVSRRNTIACQVIAWCNWDRRHGCNSTQVMGSGYGVRVRNQGMGMSLTYLGI